MKNLYLFIFAFIFNLVNAQDYNNNWVLGNSKVVFNTVPSSNLLTTNNYGYASISDDNGDLLFYSDGMKVFNKNHNLMYNGTILPSYFFDENRVQPVVIVPNPAVENQYYIFISYIETGLGFKKSSSTFVNYDYYIVDFNDSLYPDGKVLFPPTGMTLYSQANFNYFGPLTFVKNANNDGYFIIIQTNANTFNGGELRSYKIDSNGLNLSPVVSSIPNNINYYNFTDDGSFIKSTKGIMRLSPNNTKFAELVINNTSIVNSNISYSSSSFFTMDFDNDSGVFSNFNMIENNINPANTDFEFSSDSEKIYFVNSNKVFVKDLTNLSLPKIKLAQTGNSSNFPNALHLQRDKNSEIIVSNMGDNYLSKINNQNSYYSSTISIFFNLSGNLSFHFLPQLIQNLEEPCPANIVINNTVNAGVYSKQASVSINASNIINSPATAMYHAGNEVVLSSGFEAKAGSTFKAYIEGCTGNFNTSKTSKFTNERRIDMAIDNSVTLYPNPNNGNFTIDLDNKEITNVSIEIYDVYGNKVYFNGFKNDLININIGNLAKGVYFVNIKSDEINKELKFIKN